MLKASDLLAPLIYSNLPNDATLSVCWECETLWINQNECFVCGDIGDVLVVPISSNAGLIAIQHSPMKISPHHVAVNERLVDALKTSTAPFTSIQHPL